MTTNRLIIVIALVVLAAGAGIAYTQGMLPFGGGSEDGVKVPVQPIPLEREFVVNLADSDQNAFARFNIAIELEQMSQADYDTFMGHGGGGHGGGGEAPGPPAVASYPKFRDAVIAATSSYTMGELLADPEREELKKEILERFHVIAEQDEALLAAKGDDKDHHDPTHAPFHVKDVYVIDFAAQTSG